jgi:hypothetical protein
LSGESPAYRSAAAKSVRNIIAGLQIASGFGFTDLALQSGVVLTPMTKRSLPSACLLGRLQLTSRSPRPRGVRPIMRRSPGVRTPLSLPSIAGRLCSSYRTCLKFIERLRRPVGLFPPSIAANSRMGRAIAENSRTITRRKSSSLAVRSGRDMRDLRLLVAIWNACRAGHPRERITGHALPITY